MQKPIHDTGIWIASLKRGWLLDLLFYMWTPNDPSSHNLFWGLTNVLTIFRRAFPLFKYLVNTNQYLVNEQEHHAKFGVSMALDLEVK